MPVSHAILDNSSSAWNSRSLSLSLSKGSLVSELRIEVWDATGNMKQVVELPADAEVGRTIAVLIERLELPQFSPDGQLMSYKFHHRRSGRQLLDEETLAVAGVEDGDVVRLLPEITAGNNNTVL